ncbi:17S U2 SnRNP complex component HTATSF1 isoform X2 [Lepisosteus oculatus]|uniref:17S U2 SnRNP complex component HTATSF1 isoform X2 n=1 Tax=Lepisosteus oculatus TaxID=7918 RepID=UPI00371F279A
MSGESGGNEEFLEQLRLQQLYGQSREAGNGDDPYTFVDPEDGTVYDWDQEKKAWFPKITEDFLAAYHANYGFNEEGTGKPSVSEAPAADPVAQKSAPQKPQAEGAEVTQPKEGKQKEKRKADPGLPLDITPEEFVGIMSKCGIIMRDPVTEEYKIKLYKDNKGNLKGDGLCCYLKKESVALAERLIDDSEIRGYRLHVEAARFELKGEYDASKKRKKAKDYRKKLQRQQKQLDWRPEKKAGSVRKRNERVLIIQNMFHPSDFEEDPLVLNEIREDLRTECEKFGQVKKVIIFDRHPDGVASVAFKEPEEADVCQLALDGRWFGGRKLSVQHWDGTTDYQVEETNREREERLKGWASFLGEKDSGKAGGEALKDSAGQAEKGAPQDPKSSTEEPPSKLEGPGTEHPEPGGAKEEAEGSGAGVSEEAVADSTDSSLAGSEEEEESEGA